MFEELLERWDGEHAVIRHDAATGTWMLVCLHSTQLGPAMGGTRLKSYANPSDALEDALRLSAGMTRKLAVLGLPCGGGKAVLAVPSVPNGDERRRLLERYGDLVASLGGTFVTGPDVNTGEADMDVIGERSPYVFCRSAARGGSGDPSIHTALGVFHGIRATLERVVGSADLDGRTVLVQGAGSVGGKLARLLMDAEATVLVSDIDEERARGTGGVVVAPDAALETECDVYAPCALGATLNADSIPRLRCRIVAGAANNQLATPEDAERLTRQASSTRPTTSSTAVARCTGSASSSSAGTRRRWSGRSPASPTRSRASTKRQRRRESRLPPQPSNSPRNASQRRLARLSCLQLGARVARRGAAPRPPYETSEVRLGS